MSWTSRHVGRAPRRAVTALSLVLASLVLSVATAFPAILTRDLPLDAAWNPASTGGAWLAEVLADPQADRQLQPCITW